MLIRSAEMLGWALGGLEREIAETRERLSGLMAQASHLRARVGGSTTTASAGTTVVRRRRKMSREARKRISEMMKKRWAERRKAKAKA
jgi:predicted  nucleic acid-binding Zn-ribbon protein